MKASVQAGSSGARPRAGDGDEAPAIGKARQRRADVAKRGVRHAAIDMRDRRKRRVHQDDARADVGVEMIVDLRRIEARDGKAGKQPGEKPGAGIGEFVEGERAAGELGEDRKKTRAGRGLQHIVGRRDRGGGRGAEAERDRR